MTQQGIKQLMRSRIDTVEDDIHDPPFAKWFTARCLNVIVLVVGLRRTFRLSSQVKVILCRALLN